MGRLEGRIGRRAAIDSALTDGKNLEDQLGLAAAAEASETVTERSLVPFEPPDERMEGTLDMAVSKRCAENTLPLILWDNRNPGSGSEIRTCTELQQKLEPWTIVGIETCVGLGNWDTP